MIFFTGNVSQLNKLVLFICFKGTFFWSLIIVQHCLINFLFQGCFCSWCLCWVCDLFACAIVFGFLVSTSNVSRLNQLQMYQGWIIYCCLIHFLFKDCFLFFTFVLIWWLFLFLTFVLFLFPTFVLIRWLFLFLTFVYFWWLNIH